MVKNRQGRKKTKRYGGTGAKRESLKKLTGLVYLATPYTRYLGGPESAAIEAARLCGELIKRGITVYSPVVFTHPVAMCGGLDPFDHDMWMDYDSTMMELTDCLCVAMLSGWRDSLGIAEEVKFFLNENKPVWYLNPATLKLYDSWLLNRA